MVKVAVFIDHSCLFGGMGPVIGLFSNDTAFPKLPARQS